MKKIWHEKTLKYLYYLILILLQLAEIKKLGPQIYKSVPTLHSGIWVHIGSKSIISRH